MSMELCWQWDLNQEMGCHFLLLLSSSSVSSGAIGRRGEMKLWRLALLFCSRGAHFEYGPLKRIEISQGRRDGRDIRPCVTLWPLFVSTWLEEKKEPRVFRCISVCLGVSRCVSVCVLLGRIDPFCRSLSRGNPPLGRDGCHPSRHLAYNTTARAPPRPIQLS